ncbi:MAG: OmpA family protein [Terriglobia bacterium]
MKKIPLPCRYESRVLSLSAKLRTIGPVARRAIPAAVVTLSACAGPGLKNQQPAAPSPSATAQVAKAAERAPTRRLTVAVLDSKNYKAGQKQRENDLIRVAGVAALAQDKVGYYMEVQEAELRRKLSPGTDVHITKQRENIVIGPVSGAFVPGSAHLADTIRNILGTVAPVFREFTKTLITIHAYTDSTASTGYNNRKLSQIRALAVAHYLIKTGISSERIVVVGHGESDPVASNATAKGRAQNRRVKIELQPLAR